MIRRLSLRVLVVAVLATGMTGVVEMTGSGAALACTQDNARSDAYADTLPQVWFGQRNEYVLGLQRALAQQGYGLRGTGWYGWNTLHAVLDFQAKHGINASGLVGQRTWHALVGPLPAAETAMPDVPGQLRPDSTDQQLNLRLRDALARVYVHDDVTALPWDEDRGYGPQWREVVRLPAFGRHQRQRDRRPADLVRAQHGGRRDGPVGLLTTPRSALR